MRKATQMNADERRYAADAKEVFSVEVVIEQPKN
jgi:hypothetical protein